MVYPYANAMTSTSPYPSPLENWWLQRTRRLLKLSDTQNALQLLEPEVRRLSDLFTTKRASGFESYENDARALAAYGLFFFPQTFTRVGFPLRELLAYRGWTPPAERPLRILDLGAGSGAALFGAVRMLQAQGHTGPMEATAVDQSQESLTLARTIAHDLTDLWPQTSWTMREGNLGRPSTWPSTPRQWDIILLSFSFNEAFFDQAIDAQLAWLEQVQERLAPGGILLLLEPALRETSEQLERLRDRLGEQRAWTIAGPCLHHRHCPLLSEGKFWCHEVRQWQPPESLSFINRKLYRSVQSLKFSYLALENTPRMEDGGGEGGAGKARLIAPMTEVKGKFITSGCAADGRKHGYELQTRGLSKPQRKWLHTMERGDIVELFPLTPLGNGEVFRLGGMEAIRHHFHPRPAADDVASSPVQSPSSSEGNSSA